MRPLIRTFTFPFALPLAILSASACAVTSQELNTKLGELSVQVITATQESIARETEKIRTSLDAARLKDREALDALGIAGGKTRSSLEEEIKALRTKLDELQNVLVQIKKGAQTGGGSSSVVAELDVRATGDNEYRVSRKQFAEFNYELTRLASQIPLVAHFAGDKRIGLRLVDNSAFLGRFGILANDVLLGVNGIALRTPDQTREVIAKIRKDKKIVVNVLREKRRMTITVNVGD